MSLQEFTWGLTKSLETLGRPQRDHLRLPRCYLGLKEVILGPRKIILGLKEATWYPREVLWAHREVPQTCLGFLELGISISEAAFGKNVQLQHDRYSANNMI